MIRAVIQAGFGNQLFQYACAYSLAKKWNTQIELDISFFENYNKAHPETAREYSLDKLSINPSKVINKPKSYWRYRLRTKCAFLKKMDGIPFILEDIKQCRENQSELFQRIEYGSGILYGFWQNTGYFNDVLDDLREQFRPSYTLMEDVQRCLLRIKISNSVGVHIRRGDFVRLGWDKGGDYYLRGMELLRSKLDAPQFYIVSDDVAWTKQHFADRKDVTILDIHSNTKDLDEFFLLSSCKHQIISESTFGWWAAYLNSNPDKFVCMPKDAVGEIFRQGWIGI